MKSSWDTQDYEFDIINNKGQVTYEFERQAKHNNFNDITAISPEHIPMKAIFSLVVSFCLKIFMFVLLYFTLKRF